MTLALFSLFVWGVTYIVTESAIFMPFRIRVSVWSVWLDTLVHCPKCVGFWAGLFATPWLERVIPEHLFRGPLDYVVLGAAGTAVALIASRLGLYGGENETERGVIIYLRAEHLTRAFEGKPTDSQIN